MHRSPLLTVALLAAPALPQTAADLFTEGTVLIDETRCFRHALDLDGDPFTDMLGWWWPAGTNGPNILARAYRADGQGGFTQVWEIGTPINGSGTTSLSGSTLGDFDGDGEQDFALGFQWRLHVYTRQGTSLPVYQGEAWYPWDSAVWKNPLGLVATDVNGDGLDDLIAACPRSLRMYLNPGPGQDFPLADWELLNPAEPHTLVDQRIDVALGDVDGDTTPELLVLRQRTGSTAIELRAYPLAGGAFGAYTLWPLAVSEVSHLTYGDIDGDGDGDVAIFDEAGVVQVLRRTGRAQLVVEPKVPGGPATDLVDIDGDGDLDGVCCGGGGTPNPPNNLPSTYHVTLNDGGGGFELSATFPGLGSQGIAGAVDVDGDGDLDLVAGRCVLINHMEVGTPTCAATLNSTGSPAWIAAEGSASLAWADLELHAGDLPAAALGLFIAGAGPTQVPFMDGWLCVAAPKRLLPGFQALPDGTVVQPMDPNGLPASLGLVQPGSTLWFQAWYRDPAAAASGANLTPGVQVTFAP